MIRIISVNAVQLCKPNKRHWAMLFSGDVGKPITLVEARTMGGVEVCRVRVGQEIFTSWVSKELWELCYIPA